MLLEKKTIMPSYKNIPIRAAEGLHEACFDVVKRCCPENGRILDIAAGAGAFSMRLLDAGYEVAANDIDDKAWAVTGLSKYTIDLNHTLDHSIFKPPYDLIVAMEVIEHLQNPTKLLIDCRELVKDNGFVLISTPNVLDADSRFNFLRKGTLYHFSPQSYMATGHQTILPYWLLELFFAQTELVVIERKFGGFHPRETNGAKSMLTLIIIRTLRFLMKHSFKNELSANYIIYLLQKKRYK